MTSSTKQFFVVIATGCGAMAVIFGFSYLIGPSKAFALAKAIFSAEPIAAMLLAALAFVAAAYVSGGWMTSLGKTIFSAIWYCCHPIVSLFRGSFGDGEGVAIRILSYALLFPILLFTFAAGHDFMTGTWPINVLVAIVLLALGVANWRTIFDNSDEEPGLLGKVTVGALVPIAFGLAGVLCLQLAFNLFDLNVPRIRQIENTIGYVSDKSGWLDFSQWSSVCVTFGVVILGFFAPQWKIVSSYLSAKNVTHKVIGAVTCLGSFTFFSQVPVRHFSSLNTVQVTARRRSEGESRQSRLLAIRVIRQAMQDLTPDDRVYYRSLFEAVDSEVPYRYQQDFLNVETRERLTRADLHGELEQTSAILIPGSPPKTPDDKKAPTQTIVRDQSLEGLQDMFSEIVGAFRPEMKGIAGKFVEEFVDQISEKIFEEGLRPETQKVFDREEPTIRIWINQTLSTTPDRVEMKQGVGFHVDMTALREEIKVKENGLREQEDKANAEKERVEEVREPIEHVE